MMGQEPKSPIGIQSVEGAYAGSYNVAAIRSLITSAFLLREIPRFCQDRDFLRPVLAYFGPNDGLDEMADVLVNYCQTRLLFPELLSAIRGANPRQYERHCSHLWKKNACLEADGEPVRPNTFPENHDQLHPGQQFVSEIKAPDSLEGKVQGIVSVTTHWPSYWWTNLTGDWYDIVVIVRSASSSQAFGL